MKPTNPATKYELSNAARAAHFDREQLILEHMPQVRLIAKRIHDRLPEHVHLEDLVSTGVVGLISAIDRFEPGQGVKLRTYAEYKIRGAILDSLRGLDWAPRKQRRRAKEIERAVIAAEQRIQKIPTEFDIACELGISVDEYREWASDARSLRLGSLQNTFGDEDGRELMRLIPDRDEMMPNRMFERAELMQLLSRAIDRMPQSERTVLSLYYQQELSLREIAKVMELHESRISQLKTQALGRLRSLLDSRWPARGANVSDKQRAILFSSESADEGASL